MYNQKSDATSPPAYTRVAGGDSNGRGSVEMKAVKRPTLGLSIQNLADKAQVDLQLGGDDNGSPSLSKEHGLDMQRIILCYFGILGFVSLAILYGAMLGIVVGTNASLHSEIRLELSDQVDNQAYATLSEAGDYLVRVLQSYDQSVLSVTDYTCRNLFRSDFNTPLNGFPTDSTSLYYDLWNGDDPPSVTLKAPLTASTRFNGKLVSRGASAGFATQQVMSDAANWNAKLKNTMRLTSFLDDNLIHMWDSNPQIQQIYLGFDTTPPSFRRYPGRPIYTEAAAEGAAALANAMAYNPPQRPWYKDAMAKPTETVYTAPYRDYHVQDWMITGARAVYDASGSPTPIGVVGIDLLMGDIADVLNGIKFLSSGKLSLFHGVEGQVVTDIELNYATAEKNMYYSDLHQPEISVSLWRSIAAIPAGVQKKFVISPAGELLTATEDFLSGSNIFLYAKHLSQFGGQYYLVVFVSAKEILAPVTPALDKMTSSNITTSLVLMISLVVSMVLLLGMMMIMMRNIIKVFNILQENVEKLLRNVGTANGLGDGMVEVHEAASNELYQLQDSMNTMIRNMQANNESHNALSDARGAGVGTGKTGQQQLETLWNIVPMAELLDSSAPPIANAYLVQD